MLSITSQMFCQQLVYRPKNPNFGGDTFNYQQLLSSANAQDTFEDPDLDDDEQTDLERFTENLNDQLLNAVSRGLFVNQFGTDDLEPGTYTFGSLSVEIFPSNQGLVVNILDTLTGEQTQIIVPN